VIRNAKVALAVLTALNLLNYVDRYVLSAVIGPLQTELHLSGFLAGLLATIFLIGYFATSPVFGILGDRAQAGGIGVRRLLMATGVAVWSAATIATGLSGGVLSLIASRALVGVGEASYATLAPTIIDDVAPPTRTGRWMAIFSAATPMGSALGYIVGGTVLKSHGWRAAFWVAGVPGLLLAGLCLLLAEPARRHPAAGARSLAHDGAALARVPLYRGAVLGYAAYTFAIGGFAFWAPKYLHVRYLFDEGRAAQLFGLVTVVAGAVGTLSGGWLGDRMARSRLARAKDARTTDEALAQVNVYLAALTTAVGAPLAAAALAAPTATVFLLLVFPCQVALFALSGPINVALLRSAPPYIRAGAMAIAILAIHALGDIWSPPLIGFVADVTSMNVAMWIVPAAFALAAIVWGRASRASGWLT
jgi:MFS family permease